MRSPSYVGQRYHKLTVLSQYSTKKHLRLVCKCDCGNTTDVRKGSVIGASAETKSCGCLRKSKRPTQSHDPRGYLLARARERCKHSGLDFSITKEDIVVPDICPLLGIPIIPLAKDRHHSPSLDRKDSSLGYTPSNIWVISSRANTLKNNATGDELLLLATNLKEAGL
jgi:hypothetical protein